MGKRIASITGFFLFVPTIAAAQLVISEIMYDLAEGSDSGREWVEVYNEGNTAVDLTEWKFFEGNTNHGITATGGAEIPAGSYAVIADNPAKFKTDWPNFSGPLFDSAFSLNNTGESLGLRCCGKELADKDTIAYSNSVGGTGDGNSLSRSGSTFVPTSPTPAEAPSAAKPAPDSEPPPQPEAKKLPEPPPPETKQRTEPPEVSTIEVTPEQSWSEPVAQVTTVANKDKQPVQTSSEDASEETETEEKTTVETISQAAASAASSRVEETWMWWASAFAIAFLGAGSAYVIGRTRSREWNIEEIE